MSLPVHLVPSLDGVDRGSALDGVDRGSALEVTGEEAHHAVVVRRLRVG